MMPMLVMAGSASTQATVPSASAFATASRSLNSTAIVDPVGKRFRHGIQIVELHRDRGDRGIDRRSHVAFPGYRGAVVVTDRERLVHRAVIAVAEHQDLGASGDLPRD